MSECIALLHGASFEAMQAEMDLAWAIDCAGIALSLDSDDRFLMIERLMPLIPVAKRLYVLIASDEANWAMRISAFARLRSDMVCYVVAKAPHQLEEIQRALPMLNLLWWVSAQELSAGVDKALAMKVAGVYVEDSLELLDVQALKSAGFCVALQVSASQRLHNAEVDFVVSAYPYQV